MKHIVAAFRSVYRTAILLTSKITGVPKDPHESQLKGSQNIGSALSYARKPLLPLIDEECSSFFFAIQFCPEHRTTICITFFSSFTLEIVLCLTRTRAISNY